MVAVAILEGAATADAAANLGASDVTKVRNLAAEMEQVAAEGDLTKFSRLNRRLHATIFARCANTYLLELLEQTNQRLDRIRDTMFTYLPERSKAAIGEHAHLIGLLERATPTRSSATPAGTSCRPSRPTAPPTSRPSEARPRAGSPERPSRPAPPELLQICSSYSSCMSRVLAAARTEARSSSTIM